MEYSFRRAEGIIALNGLFVWHEPFEYKFSKVLKSYFLCRNCMIINTIHKDRFSLFHVLATAVVHFFVQILVHDYESAGLTIDAVNDYLKGGEWFLKSNDEEIMKRKKMELSPLQQYNRKPEGYKEIDFNFKRFDAFMYFFFCKDKSNFL